MFSSNIKSNMHTCKVKVPLYTSTTHKPENKAAKFKKIIINHTHVSLELVKIKQLIVDYIHVSMWITSDCSYNLKMWKMSILGLMCHFPSSSPWCHHGSVTGPIGVQIRCGIKTGFRMENKAQEQLRVLSSLSVTLVLLWGGGVGGDMQMVPVEPI